MLGRGVLVLHVGGDGFRFFEKLCQFAPHSHFHCTAADAGFGCQALFQVGLKAISVSPHPIDNGRDDPSLLSQQGQEEMLRVDADVFVFAGLILGLDNCFASLLSQAIESH